MFFKYVYARHFTLVTDHKPFVVNSTSRKRFIFLSNYDYDVVYKPTKENGNANNLHFRMYSISLSFNKLKKNYHQSKNNCNRNNNVRWSQTNPQSSFCKKTLKAMASTTLSTQKDLNAFLRQYRNAPKKNNRISICYSFMGHFIFLFILCYC